MRAIERIAVKPFGNAGGAWRCEILVGRSTFSFPFHDLVEFSDGLQDILAETERVVPVNAERPKDRDHMQLEGLRVQDSSEHNRNFISGREARERKMEGEHIAAGAWYMELSINGSDTDVSFDTVAQLFQIVQQVIKRELAGAGVLILQTPTDLSRAH